MDDAEPLVDKVEEAAAILKVSQRTIWNLVRRGRARTIKVMGATRVIHADIMRIARDGTVSNREAGRPMNPQTGGWGES